MMYVDTLGMKLVTGVSKEVLVIHWLLWIKTPSGDGLSVFDGLKKSTRHTN